MQIITTILLACFQIYYYSSMVPKKPQLKKRNTDAEYAVRKRSFDQMFCIYVVSTHLILHMHNHLAHVAFTSCDKHMFIAMFLKKVDMGCQQMDAILACLKAVFVLIIGILINELCPMAGMLLTSINNSL